MEKNRYPIFFIPLFLFAAAVAAQTSLVQIRIEDGGVENLDFRTLPVGEVRIAIEAVKTERIQPQQNRADHLLGMIAQLTPVPEPEKSQVRQTLLAAIKDGTRKERAFLIAMFANSYRGNTSAAQELLPLLDDQDEGVRIAAVQYIGKYAPPSFASALEEKLNARTQQLGAQKAATDATLRHGWTALATLRARTQ